MAASVDITDQATPALQRVAAALRRAVAPAIGAAVVDLFQRHFASLPSNAHGWPSTNFWQRAARATNYSILPDGVAINVTQQGVRQRLEGGTITATNGGRLAIPARSEYYGHRAREFSNLRVAFFGRVMALVTATATSFSTSRKGKVKPGIETGGGVAYWLVKSVNQAANPNVIPSTFEIAAAAISTTNDIVERAALRGGR